MKPEVSLPCLQEPATCMSQMNPVYTFESYFFKTNFNIILPPTPGTSKWSLAFTFAIKTLYA